MKVIILAGGLGTRLGELTERKPKPMIEIGNKPILWHIMKIYASFGFNEFIVALGYKSLEIKNFFSNYALNTKDFEIDMATGNINFLDKDDLNWKVTLVDTGLNTMTGGRIKRLKDFINEETFMLTYGDGVADINIRELFHFHKKNKKIVTVTAVRPIARFGELVIEDTLVRDFQEKPQISEGWVNGGFFVCEPSVFDFIKDDQTVFERDPLEDICKIHQLAAFKHNGFWQCMDTKRDKKNLDDLWQRNKAYWSHNW